MICLIVTMGIMFNQINNLNNKVLDLENRNLTEITEIYYPTETIEFKYNDTELLNNISDINNKINNLENEIIEIIDDVENVEDEEEAIIIGDIY